MVVVALFTEASLCIPRSEETRSILEVAAHIMCVAGFRVIRNPIEAFATVTKKSWRLVNNP